MSHSTPPRRMSPAALQQHHVGPVELGQVVGEAAAGDDDLGVRGEVLLHGTPRQLGLRIPFGIAFRVVWRNGWRYDARWRKSSIS